MATKLDRDAVIDAAMALAEERGWEQMRLHELAAKLDVELGEIGALFRDADAIANAWFARARARLLDLPATEIEGRTPPERLEIAITTWLNALAPYRTVTGQMLSSKFYPGHPHHWVPAIFDLSRLVHWLLDAARIKGEGRLRQIEEIGLTLLVLATLRDWVGDTSETQQKTRDRLRKRLAGADRLLARLKI